MRAPGQRSLSNPVAMPGPQPKPQMTLGVSRGILVSSSSAGRRRSLPNRRYWVGLRVATLLLVTSVWTRCSRISITPCAVRTSRILPVVFPLSQRFSTRSAPPYLLHHLACHRESPRERKGATHRGLGFASKPSFRGAKRQCHWYENVMRSQPQRRSIWGGASPPPPQIPRPSREGLGMTGRCPFSSAVVLVATSMKDSQARSDNVIPRS